ncbi:MAG: dynamin family protein [Dehalococcoidia bacterium]
MEPLSEELDRLVHVATSSLSRTELELAPLLQEITASVDRLHRAELRVAFFGAVKTGKSTLLNALLGARLLPSRANRATGVATTISYSLIARVSVLRLNATGNPIETEVPLDEIDRYLRLDLSGSTAQPAPGVEEVLIGVPLPLLADGLVLVDTPGLMDNEGLDRRCLHELERADLAVMVLAADRLLSEAEKLAATRADELLAGNLLFVVNRFGLIAAEERMEVRAWAREGLEGFCNSRHGAPSLIFSDAREALESRRRPASGAEPDGVAQLEDRLLLASHSPSPGSIALAARLAGLDRRAAALQEICGRRLLETGTAAETLRNEETRRLRERAATQAQAIAMAQVQLAAMAGSLEQDGLLFVEDCANYVDGSTGAAQLSPQRIHDALRSATDAYAQRLRQRAQAAVTPHGMILAVPAPAVSDWRIAGGALRSAAPRLARSLLRVDLKAAARELITEAAREALPALREERRRYLADVENWLSSHTMAPESRHLSSSALHEATRLYEYYREVDRWCAEVRAAVTAAMTALS